MEGLSNPADAKPVPGLPENLLNITWEKYEGLNTKPPRPGIGDGELFWCDGWMPIGPNNLRVLWGTGDTIYTALGTRIVWFGFGNINGMAVGIVLQDDGALHQFNAAGGGRAQILGAGAILSPTSIFGFSQWGSQYLLFAKDQPNGYWVWDGTNVFTAGTLSPVITLTNAGFGYISSPVITFQTTGAGTGMAAHALLLDGSVSQVVIDSAGTGFASGDFVIATTSGGGTDAQATGIATTTTAGGVVEVIITSPGAGYTSAATVVFSGGGGSGATGYAAIQNGAVVSIALSNVGTGYTSPPSVTIIDPGLGSGASHINGGTGFAGVTVINSGQISTVGITSGGSGYVSNPTVVVIGDGTGAQITAQVTGGNVTGLIINNPGSGYTKALLLFQGGNNSANLMCDIFPFGISGTTIETYNQRVWISNGAATASFPPKNRTIFSDPGSPVGFGSGGGSFQSTDSFLRIGYYWLKQTNGFLYLGGDSSVNYISGVQTSPTGTITSIPVTTFGNQNVDPQIGSPWPSSVQVFSRNIVFANTAGVYVSYGGAVTKASLPLDGFYSTGPIYDPTSNFSSAVAQIFGIPVYMLLLPVIDQFNGDLEPKLLMWDGKRWFTTQQERFLTFIAGQEINSVLTAWGTDGTDIFPLFARPTIGFRKVIQSKLFAAPHYYVQKTALKLNGVFFSYALDELVTINLDTERGIETGASQITLAPTGTGLIWTNNDGDVISWTNASGQMITWGNGGLDVFGPIPMGQQGRMIGFTVTTTATDIALLSLNAVGMIETVNI